MYDERKERFSVRDLIIQVLFVAIFVFLLLWLFPMKSDVKNSVSKSVKETVTPLYDQIFNQNVMSMKESAISYYTTSRLPKNIGDTEKMTLSKMLSENIILPFVDRNGKQCDLDESYVSITKMNDEYIMKINLRCSNEEDYLLVHLGCYNYCDGGVCEKKEEEPAPTPAPVVKPVNNDPTPVVVQDRYSYEYVLVTNGRWGEYSNWSDWTTNVINKTDYRDVETKTEDVTTYKTEKKVTSEPVYEAKQVQVDTKKEAYTEEVAVTKYRTVPVYTTQQVQTGTRQEAYTAYRTVPTYSTYTVQTGTKEETYTTTEQQFVKMEYSLDCSNGCKRVEKPVYETVTVTKTRTVPVYETRQEQTGSTEESYTAYRTVPVYETQTVQTGTRQEAYTTTETVTKYKDVPVYETQQVQTGTKEVVTEVQVPVVNKVTYYRSRTREYISGTVKTAWSESQNDQSLISQGYTLTGNSKKI